jgi:hypothetical protein
LPGASGRMKAGSTASGPSREGRNRSAGMALPATGMGHLRAQWRQAAVNRFNSELFSATAKDGRGLTLFERSDGVFQALIQDNGAVPAGYIHFTWERGPFANYPRVLMLNVFPQYRRLGVATALAEAFSMWVRSGPESIDWGDFTPEGAVFWKAWKGETVRPTKRSAPTGRYL